MGLASVKVSHGIHIQQQTNSLVFECLLVFSSTVYLLDTLNSLYISTHLLSSVTYSK